MDGVQYWTSKGNKFYSAQNRFFRGNWVLGSFLGRLKMSKIGFEAFPMVFRVKQFLRLKI